MQKLNLLVIGKRQIRVNPTETKTEIDNKHEALAAIIILAKNNTRETFKKRLKSVKEAYVQRRKEEEEKKSKEKIA